MLEADQAGGVLRGAKARVMRLKGDQTGHEFKRGRIWENTSGCENARIEKSCPRVSSVQYRQREKPCLVGYELWRKHSDGQIPTSKVVLIYVYICNIS